jgi:hypothetical protein
MTRPVVDVLVRKLGYRFMAAEAWWILSGRNDVESIRKYSPHIASFSDDGKFFHGAYGPKILDQLTYVIDSLQKDADTRQAVLSIWRENPRVSRDVPCTISAQWLIRDGKLHCIDTMRSSDAWLGWPYDVFNFSCLSAYILLMLRERASFFNSVRLGCLSLVAGSSHLYLHPDEDGASNIPYTVSDVEHVIESELVALEDGRCTHRIQYAPLNVGDFVSPEDFLTHLGARKDRCLTPHSWLQEFLPTKENI